MAKKARKKLSSVELLQQLIVNASTEKEARGLIDDVLVAGELEDVCKRLSIAFHLAKSSTDDGEISITGKSVAAKLRVSPGTVSKTKQHVFGNKSSGVLSKHLRELAENCSLTGH